MTHYTADIEPIIREAGALLMSYFQRRIGYEYKGDVDLVTEADRASEKFLAERLRARWPEFGIAGRGRNEVRPRGRVSLAGRSA